MKKYVVIGGPSSEDLAQKISKKLNAKFLKTELKIFSDGESKITIKRMIKAQRVIVVQSTHMPVDRNFVQAFSLIYQARKMSSEVYAVIPYVGYAKQDKEFLKGEIITIAVIAKLFKAAGATKLIVVDIHSDEELNFFKIPTKNLSAVPLLADYFQKIKLKNPLIVSPDLFWKKKAKEFAKILNCNSIALNKQRNRNTGKLVIKSPKFPKTNFQDIILLDDMVSTGGSIVKAIEFLKKKNLGRIYVACTHAVLADNAEKRLKKAGVYKIISTNSISGKHAFVDLSRIISKTIQEW
ncbi:phosphoribosylpyrophosphate synthetase [Nitrosopumilus sp. b3]|uniref:ribose-phosphate diphosphokinase n=1 Tax=Nitrosopumilus sp. b3 TaxID=2109909 RepID=UPI0015F404C3|nr:ribose-phosphate diphosphokinase [Nitrosopumilus sp. b3]KAF6246248.1 phosphoribosylpyrophosphate synthetase [Nitrosopumilus sp. b3]